MSEPRRRVINIAETRKAAQKDSVFKEIGGRYGMYPLDAPGMPPPGPNFLAQALGEDDDTVYVPGKKGKKHKDETVFVAGRKLSAFYSRALRDPNFTLALQVKPNVRKTVGFVPGHIWGEHFDEYVKSLTDPAVPLPKVTGPAPADVMVIGKAPWREEQAAKRNFVGTSGNLLIEVLRGARLFNCHHWYVTNLIKFTPPDDQTRISSDWLADCLPLLHQELRIVRPKYILCLGADALKALLGKDQSINSMHGRVVDYTYDIRTSHKQEERTHTAKLMAVVHPAQVAHGQADVRRVLEQGVNRFGLMVNGATLSEVEEGLDHRCCESLEEAVKIIAEARTYLSALPPADRLVAWDAEWHGQHPVNKGAYLRTVQMTWKEKQGVCFKLCHAGGSIAFKDKNGKNATKKLMALLTDFSRETRAVGHFLVADLEWLQHYGFNLLPSFRVPLHDAEDGTPAWCRAMRGEGGLDTSMMAHAIEETAKLGLESLVTRYVPDIPRYDLPLEKWKKQFCKDNKIKAAALEGYGDCPDDVLVPYAIYDTDATYRLAKVLLKLLDSDYDGNCCWEPFWESMIIQPAILEMHQVGMEVDRAKIDKMSVDFYRARCRVEDEIKQKANWPDFNVRSVNQVREYLFGEKLNGSRDENGQVRRLRPAGAHTLGITPLIDTSKPPQRWKDVVARGKEEESNPSTGKMALAIMAQDNESCFQDIRRILDYRFLDQVLKSVLRPPLKKEGESEFFVGDDGFLVYEKGLVSCIGGDGRVRTHLSPTAETGRWKSSRPNMQNMSKSRDKDYERLLGADVYKDKLRSIIKAPAGKVIVEADYKGAELYGMALMAGDTRMIEHCERANNFPEEGYDEDGNKVKGGKYPHPEYYDIHSNIAVLAFRLPCKPNKQALKVAKLEHFRTLAKNVIFGIAYGRGAKAIALQAKENKKKEDPEVTVEEAQATIDAIFSMYPALPPFFAACQTRAVRQRWLANCFGRLRRFPPAIDEAMEGEFGRQAMNFPIQSMIASCLDRGVAYLTEARDSYYRETGVWLFDWQLTIHDAIVLLCDPQHVNYVAGTLIPWAMCESVPIYPTGLDGRPLGTGPYHLGIDISVQEAFGAPMSAARREELGIALHF